jgi:hypothetical protein
MKQPVLRKLGVDLPHPPDIAHFYGFRSVGHPVRLAQDAVDHEMSSQMPTARPGEIQSRNRMKRF